METKAIAWITGSLTLLLALFSFTLSFNALTDLAAQHNISIPYLFPLVVEAGVIIFSLNALHRSLHGEHARWQWVLIIGSSIIAGAFNVLHAQLDIVSRVMSAMPSLFLLFSFESFLSQLKHGVTRSTIIQSIKQLTEELHSKQAELETLVQTKQTELDTLTQAATRLNSEIEQAQVKLTALHSEIEQARRVQLDNEATPLEQRRQQLLQLLTREGDLGPSAFAQRLNTSRGTVYSDLNALKAAGLITKNGQGWEVVG